MTSSRGLDVFSAIHRKRIGKNLDTDQQFYPLIRLKRPLKHGAFIQYYENYQVGTQKCAICLDHSFKLIYIFFDNVLDIYC